MYKGRTSGALIDSTTTSALLVLAKCTNTSTTRPKGLKNRELDTEEAV